MGKTYKLSAPQFPHLYHGDNSMCLSGMVQGLCRYGTGRSWHLATCDHQSWVGRAILREAQVGRLVGMELGESGQGPGSPVLRAGPSLASRETVRPLFGSPRPQYPHQ